MCKLLLHEPYWRYDSVNQFAVIFHPSCKSLPLEWASVQAHPIYCICECVLFPHGITITHMAVKYAM